MFGPAHGGNLLPAVPPDKMGVPGQLSDHQHGSELGRRREHGLLPLPPGVLGRAPGRQDVQALLEHQPHDGSRIHERRFRTCSCACAETTVMLKILV